MVTKKKPTSSTIKNSKHDLIQLILEHHKPLKKLIKNLKDADKPLSARKKAFETFWPLLTSHAKAEEQVLYTRLESEEDTRVDGLEGDVEHGLADQMVKEIKATEDKDLWTAKAKVLAELVEHHIKEEEEEVLPQYRKDSEVEERRQKGELYLRKRKEFAIAVEA